MRMTCASSCSSSSLIRSWVIGRGAVCDCSFIRIAAASGCPIQMGRNLFPSAVFRRTIGCLPTKSKLTPYICISCKQRPRSEYSSGVRGQTFGLPKLRKRHVDDLPRHAVADAGLALGHAHRLDAEEDDPAAVMGDNIADLHCRSPAIVGRGAPHPYP